MNSGRSLFFYPSTKDLTIRFNHISNLRIF